MNYINSMGRLAEAEGESAVWRDLRMKIFIDPVAMKSQYEASPAWLKMLMNAWADGLNFYLARHPQVHPRVIKRFEPWMALSFTEGSIGGDIERIDLKQLESFYARKPVLASVQRDTEPRGSNGIAIAPKLTTGGGSLLLIGKLLGHKDTATTAKYAHLFDDPVRAAADATSAQLAAWMQPKKSPSDDVRSISRRPA